MEIKNALREQNKAIDNVVRAFNNIVEDMVMDGYEQEDVERALVGYFDLKRAIKELVQLQEEICESMGGVSS